MVEIGKIHDMYTVYEHITLRYARSMCIVHHKIKCCSIMLQSIITNFPPSLLVRYTNIELQRVTYSTVIYIPMV